MKLNVRLAKVGDVAALRERYRREVDCQIVHWSLCLRFPASVYVVQCDGKMVGYGIVDRNYEKGTVNEFWIVPRYRRWSREMFAALLKASRATGIRAQTNDRLMLNMLYEFGDNIRVTRNLFEDRHTTRMRMPGATFRKRRDGEKIFRHRSEPVGDWVVEAGGRVVATGGAFFHYNKPYGDVYMEVDAKEREKGYGSFLVQEVKRVVHAMRKMPAARCNVANVASRRTLEKAGFEMCGRVLNARVRRGSSG